MIDGVVNFGTGSIIKIKKLKISTPLFPPLYKGRLGEVNFTF